MSCSKVLFLFRFVIFFSFIHAYIQVGLHGCTTCICVSCVSKRFSFWNIKLVIDTYIFD